MKPPLFVRPLAESERTTLRQGLRSPVVAEFAGLGRGRPARIERPRRPPSRLGRHSLPPCVYAASLPSSAPKRSGPATLPDRRRPGLRRPDRPRRPPGVRRPGPGPPATPAQDPQDHPHRLAQAARPRPTRLAAPVPAQPGQADQPVDVAPGRSGLLRKGLGRRACSAARPSAWSSNVWASAGSGQALADQPRPGGACATVTHGEPSSVADLSNDVTPFSRRPAFSRSHGQSTDSA